MKKVIFGFSLLLAFVFFSCAGNSAGLKALYTPGVYEGNGEGYFGPVILEVTVSSGAIVQIDVLQYSDTQGIGTTAFDELTVSVIDANSVDVDIVAGASYSSRGFLDAVEDALQKAVL
ncbi:MAG: FMN-binding protein [Spirochaetaceae bacterium]|nr:FMN-binding protein [Spirochaetaceae bacterium]